MKHVPTIVMGLVLAGTTLLPVCIQATVYVNETFDAETIGSPPSDPAKLVSSQVTVAAGSGAIGADNVAWYNDAGGTVGALEYNVGGSALGSLYVSFDLLNNAPNPTGTAANPLQFAFGNWSTLTSAQLNSSSKRSFNVQINNIGASGTLKLQADTASGVTTTLQSTTYDMSALNTFKVWVNDNDTSTLFYTRPDNSSVATLAANSAVVWLNDALIGTEADSGFAMNNVTAGTGNTTGNNTLGRVGFVSTAANLANFLIDNVYIADPVVVPEPSAFALAGFAGLLLVWARRRQAQ